MKSLIVICEVLYLCLGGVIFLYHPSRKISEVLSQGIILALILLSFIFQVSFLLEKPIFAFALEILSIVLIGILLKKRINALKIIISKIVSFINSHKIIVSIIFICWFYLFMLTIFIPPANWDSMTYNLTRVFLFQQDNTLFLKNVTTLRQSQFVVGADILNHAFLRFYTDYGVGLFSFLAYISIGLGTYALARKFSSLQISLLSTLVIVGMPELVFQATSTKNDIFTAATAIFCFISAARVLKSLNIQDLSLLLLGLMFGISAKITFIPFLIPFLICFSYLFIKKYGIFQIAKLCQQNWRILGMLSLPLLILSQIWLFIYNKTAYQEIVGKETTKIVVQVAQDNNKLIGGTANLIRYLLQSFHLFPFDYILSGRLGINIGNFIESIYQSIVQPIFGNKGVGYAYGSPYNFSIKTIPHEDFSWYGPWGFFIVIPAILFSLLKGDRYLKATSLTLIGFMIIVSYGIYWTPWNNRYITLFFVSSGACISFFLQTILKKNSKVKTQLLIGLSIFILMSSIVLNLTKPLGGLSIKEFFRSNIWLHTNFGNERLYFAKKRYSDNRVEKVSQLIPEDSKVALVAGQNTWIYHFYLTNPNTRIEPTKLKDLYKEANLYDYILCIDVICDLNDLNAKSKILWQNIDKSKRFGKLIEILH